MVETLRQAIRDSGLSINALARATGISPPIISRFLSEQRGIQFETAAKLADYLGLKLELTGRKPTRKGTK